LAGGTSYILTQNLSVSSGSCLTITGNGTSVDLNGFSISGGGPGTGSGISAIPGNNTTISGPGIIHDFEACIVLGDPGVAPYTVTPPSGGKHDLIQNVLVYNCEAYGIRLVGGFGKCVECRVHDVRGSEVNGVGISLGQRLVDTNGAELRPGQPGCLLESSIVERSDIGAWVGQDCKVWDLVVDGVTQTGLRVGVGTSVARTVISHYHDGPGLDYRACLAGSTNQTANGCQDSSNSVAITTGAGLAIADALTSTDGVVITDCATNAAGIKYLGTTGKCT
jgi:hypothetical protein